MKNFKDGIALLKFNLSSVILFEIMHKIISVAILAPIVYAILNFSIDIAGLNYLYSSTMMLYFTKPSTYACLFVIIMILAMFFLVNICGIICAMDYSKRGEKTNPIVLLLKGVMHALRVISPKNMGIIFYVLAVLPVTFSVMISGSLFGIQLPEFFRQFIKVNERAIGIVLVIYVIICIVTIFRIFALNYFTLHRFKFGESVQLSKKVMKHHALGIFLGVIFLNVALVGIMFVLETVFALVAKGVLSNFISSKALSFGVDIAAEIIFFVVYITFSVISTPLIYSYICACFYRFEEECDNEEVLERRAKRLEEIEENKAGRDVSKRNSIAYGAIVVFGILLNGLYIYLSMTNQVELDIYYSTRALVTAHRGDSKHAPENTMAAIRLAVENQADIVEIDIRQTKDGVLVLMHDESLLRTTGVDKLVGEVDYDYVSSLDPGSDFSEEYAGERVPTLREVLEYGKENNVFYNIELKPEDYYEGYVEQVVSLINEFEYENDCVVASSDEDVLMKVKMLNPDIKTVCILYVVYGNFQDMEFVDGYSVRHNFVNKDLVKKIHGFDKEIYVWTVNSETKIKKLLLLDVDSIITDIPYEAKEIIYSANESLFTDWLGRLIEEY